MRSHQGFPLCRSLTSRRSCWSLFAKGGKTPIIDPRIFLLSTQGALLDLRAPANPSPPAAGQWQWPDIGHGGISLWGQLLHSIQPSPHVPSLTVLRDQRAKHPSKNQKCRKKSRFWHQGDCSKSGARAP